MLVTIHIYNFNIIFYSTLLGSIVKRTQTMRS